MMSDEKEDSVLLGKFTIGNILGAGAFGKVYLARNLRTGKRVAIKAIEKEKLKEINCGDDRIKTEISIMRTLKHPNIVQLYEVMASKTKIYLVMEYINGGTVYERIRSAGETGEHTSRRYFQQLISAVDFCHRNGIYHRDLKPDNLLLDNRGNLKVADFGLSAFQDQVGKDGLFHTLCGAACYVAPEVLSGENYDGAKADIWACGVILYELIAGDLPFGNDSNLGAMLKKMSTRKYSCPKRFSFEVRELLFRLLDPNPNSRITIPEIMEAAWFKMDFKDNRASWWASWWASRWASWYHRDGDNTCHEIEDEVKDKGNPPCLNAFNLLASWPSGLNLAPLFEGSRGVMRFMSKQPLSVIISKLENIAKANGFSFVKKQWTVNMEGEKMGVQAKFFEVAASLYAVDVSKTVGNTADYEKFRDQHIIPALEDVLWAWQGTHSDEKNGSMVNPLWPLLERMSGTHDKNNGTVASALVGFLVGMFGMFVLMSRVNKK